MFPRLEFTCSHLGVRFPVPVSLDPVVYPAHCSLTLLSFHSIHERNVFQGKSKGILVACELLDVEGVLSHNADACDCSNTVSIGILRTSGEW